MNLLLTDLLPLAEPAELGIFDDDTAPLAHRYGDLRRTRFKCRRISATKHFAGFHPMEITRAFVGNLETATFDFKTGAAANGRSYTYVEFNAPVPLGTEVTASGVGKRNATTGALIENPSDILADLLEIAGRSDPWFGQLRSEASAAGIVLAGSFPGTLKAPKIRDAIDLIVDNAGAIWTPGAARLYPIAFEGFRIPLDRFDSATANVKVSASITDTFDILKVRYDYDEVEGRNQGFLTLEARPFRFDGLDSTLDLPLVRSAAVAESIGRRVLTRGAGERYDVELETNATEFVRPCTWALLDHPQWAFDSTPNIMLTGATIKRTEKRARVTAEAITTAPTITLTAHSVGGNSIAQGGVSVDVRNGIATFTIQDPQGRALVGAWVTLDRGTPKKTDGAGKVAFTVTQTGQHEIAISATGFVDVALIITL